MARQHAATKLLGFFPINKSLPNPHHQTRNVVNKYPVEVELQHKRPSRCRVFQLAGVGAVMKRFSQHLWWLPSTSSASEFQNADGKRAQHGIDDRGREKWCGV
jgi:hypothetical protein